MHARIKNILSGGKVFSQQHITKMVERISLEEQLDPRGPIAYRGDLFQNF